MCVLEKFLVNDFTISFIFVLIKFFRLRYKKQVLLVL